MAKWSGWHWCQLYCYFCMLVQHIVLWLMPACPGPNMRFLQVFSKGAKFSMFKPAEEMVYIGLDEESRTKGKAAIDVVGAQTGKSGGSVLQQVCSQQKSNPSS